MQRIKAKAFDELKALDAEPSTGPAKGKGVFEMKFMKAGLARSQANTDRMVDEFIKEMGASGEPLVNSDGEEVEPGIELSGGGSTVQRVGGRVIYRPGDLVGDCFSSSTTRLTDAFLAIESCTSAQRFSRLRYV